LESDVQDPNVVEVLVSAIRWPRDTVFVLRHDDPWWRIVFDSVATFATLAGFTLAYCEWRRANREERLRRTLEQQTQAAVDHRIGNQARALTLEIDKLLSHWDSPGDWQASLPGMEASLQSMVGQTANASADVVYHINAAKTAFYRVLARRSVPWKDDEEDIRRLHTWAGAMLGECSDHLKKTMPIELR
jgi:hypothetical protein